VAGNTRVLCAASVERRVPPFLAGSGQGWVTAEYGCCPAQPTNGPRASPSVPAAAARRSSVSSALFAGGLRLVGARRATGHRGLRRYPGRRRDAYAGFDRRFCALKQAVERMRGRGFVERNPLIEHVAAISVGIVDGEVLLDLDYSEDSRADTDMNLVLTESGRIVEVQATAEHVPFDFEEFSRMYGLAARAIGELVRLQHASFKSPGV